MKILMLCDFYNERLEYQENILTKFYTKHGHDVVVIASTFESVFDYYSDNHDNRAPRKVYFDNGAKIIKLPYRFNFLNRLRCYESIERILVEEGPELIYVHDIMLNFPEVINYVKKNRQCRLIMDYHADYSNSGKNWVSLKILHGLIRKRYLDQARPFISKIFPIVPEGIRFLHDIYKVPISEMEVLPLGADVDMAQEVKEGAGVEGLREKLGLSQESRVVVTGGKLSPRKRTELLIDAINRLSESMGNVVLLVIGAASAEDQNYFEMLSARVGASTNVQFLGWLSSREVYECFALSDLAVFPASQSILWQQAIAAGLPLIVGDAGGQSAEYLNLHENIVVLEAQDINAGRIYTEIKQILGSEDLLSMMSQGALKTARSELDWNHLINKTLQFNNPI